MLVVTQEVGAPMKIGDAVVYFEPVGHNKVRVAIDAPEGTDLLRGDLVRAKLEALGWTEVAYDKWQRGQVGPRLTCRDTLKKAGLMP
jgi:sRNA-binding carbon storage regulator CsrA